jgi:hypothetical protein
MVLPLLVIGSSAWDMVGRGGLSSGGWLITFRI